MEMGKTIAVVEFVTFEGTAPVEPEPVAPPQDEPVEQPVSPVEVTPELAPVG